MPKYVRWSIKEPLADMASPARIYQVEKGIEEVDHKATCRAVALTNTTLPPGGTTFTADGISMANGERVLLPFQTNQTQNGIYVVSGIGTSVVLTRDTDADTSAKLGEGHVVSIAQGSQAGIWQMVSAPPIVLGTTNLVYRRIGETTLRRVTALTDAATIAVNSDTTDVGTVTLGGNRTLGNPTGTPLNGQKLQLRVRQDGTGSRTLSYGSAYRFSTDLPSPTLSTAINKTDYLLFQYHSADAKWDLLALNRGF